MNEEAKTNSSEITGRLFSVVQITLATFLGMPMAGFLLLAQNYRQLGKISVAWQSLVAGIGLTVILFFIALWLPENFPNMALPVAYSIGMRQLVMYLQGSEIANQEAQGKKGSWAITIAVSLVCLIVNLALIFVFVMALDIQ